MVDLIIKATLSHKQTSSKGQPETYSIRNDMPPEREMQSKCEDHHFLILVSSGDVSNVISTPLSH
jgi:hypothetical protein